MTSNLPLWLDTTAPLWTFVAVTYGLIAIYQVAFSKFDYPWWSWGSMLAVCAAIISIINSPYYFHSDSSALTVIEYGTILTFGAVGVVLFYAFRQYAKERTVRERVIAEIEKRDIELEIPDDL